MAEREQQVLNSVPKDHREKLETIIHQYRDVFPERLSKVYLQIGRYNIKSRLNRVASLPIGHLANWVLLNRMSLRSKLKISWLKALFTHLAVHTGH